MNICSYYQAHVNRPQAWFLVAILRSFEHLAFDRTFDTQHHIFEFFVPEDGEDYFVEVMRYFEQQNIVTQLQKLPNRLANPAESV